MTGLKCSRRSPSSFCRGEISKPVVQELGRAGIDPDHAHRRLGHALLSQLSANLSALRVERMETVVKTADLALPGFFQSAGFTPSQRLSFVRR